MLALAYLTYASDTGAKYAASSVNQHFNIVIYPKNGQPLIGQYHQWVVQVNDAKNIPLENARIGIGGGMENHGHGLPSKPQVTHYLGDGKYLIEGLLFNMSGRWSLLFAIQTAQASDQVRVDFDVEF